MAKIAGFSGQRIYRAADGPALTDPGAEWSVARSLGNEPGPIGLVGNFDLASGRDVLNVTSLTAAQGSIIQSYAAIDYVGRSTATGDVNGDGNVDLIIGAGNQAFVIFGTTGGIPATVSLATLSQAAGFVMLGGSGDDAGYSVAAADINNDGYDDVIVGARTGNTGSVSLGEAYVIYGHAGTFGTPDGAGRGVIDLATFAAAVGFVAPRDANSNPGLAVASAGDVNNDGFEDILLGGHLVYGHAGTSFGTVNGGGRAILDLSTSSVTILGDQDGVNAGASASSAGDLNNDGFDDFIIGAPMGLDDTAPFSQGGEYYIVFGKAAAFTSPIDLGDLAPADGFFIRNAGLFIGEGPAFTQPDLIGLTRSSSAAPAGDVNGDGFADIILNRGRSGDGGALVLFGHAGGFGTVDASGRAQLDGAALTPAQGFYIPLVSAIGFDVSGAGDFNGDGFDDVIVSRMFFSGLPGEPRRGEAYVVYGGATIGYIDASGRQTVDLDHLSPADGFLISDNMAASGLGSSVSAAGDLNGDGFDDILVGAPHLGNMDGGAYVIYGRALPDPGSIFGTPGPDSNLNGTAGNDEIHGLAGNDSINGLAGADEMYGGDGDDFYFVDNANDLVIEGRNGGNDVIIASLSYALLAGSEVEYLITSDTPGTGAINFTGNELANQIWGNTGANTLSGGGGNDILFGFGGNDTLIGDAGLDQMFGGTGDDLFIVAEGDQVFDTPGEGFDIVVVASGFYRLNAGASIELLTSGWADGLVAGLNIGGNDLAQQIWGNNAANILVGGGGDDTLFGFGGDDTLYGEDGNDTIFGGAGTDEYRGGLGNDTYFVEQATDLVIEVAGEGSDVLAASVDYALSTGASIELMTTGFIGGTGTLNFTGSDLDNQIWGNNGTNALAGMHGNDALLGFGGNDRLDGGLGSDLLVGGDGQDNFVFASTLGPNNIDQIADFVVADDTILLDDAVFAGLSLGALDPNAFVTGSAALDTNDRIIYDAAAGRLYFDADGSGAGAAVLFATLSGNPALTASDFTVI